MGHFENSCRTRSDRGTILENYGFNMVFLSKLLNCGYKRPENQQIKGWRFHYNSFTTYGKLNMVISYVILGAGYLQYKSWKASQVPQLSAEGEAAPPFPTIQSTHSLVAKHVTPEKWAKHCGIYAGDQDSYEVFADVFDPIIEEYHGLPKGFAHTSDMDVSKINGNIDAAAPVHSTRIRVGRSVEGFGLSPGITRDQRLGLEVLMKSAFAKLAGDLAGKYFPLLGMEEADRLQLVDDHFLFVSGDKNLIAAGMERDWPEGRGIFHNAEKSFLVWVNEEDQLRIISMQGGGDVKGVFSRLARGIKAVGDSVKAESGKDFMLSPRLG